MLIFKNLKMNVNSFFRSSGEWKFGSQVSECSFILVLAEVLLLHCHYLCLSCSLEASSDAIIFLYI